MADTTPIQIRWPNVLARRVRDLANRRHTTVSELTRQAVIDAYFLHEDDLNSSKNGTDAVTAVHNGGTE